MSVKVLMLKSGEDVIADVSERFYNDRVIGYTLDAPYIISLDNRQIEDQKTFADIAFSPWMPVSKERKISIPTDWVVTIVEPIDKVKTLYNENILNR